MKDLKTALQDLAKAKGFNTDGLSDKELFQIVTGGNYKISACKL